jgi:HK97 family phage major capsid protein
MNSRFSLINAIRNVVNNQPVDEITKEVNARGMQEFRNAGLSYSGQIQLPVGELRANITVAAEGEDIVPTELWDVVGPLRSKNVLVNAGAKFLSGLSADVQIPVMGPTSVYWETETAPAQDGGNVFSNVTLSPKRLTAYVHISKQLLLQSAPDVENLIRQDLINAINSKLEATILGDAAPIVGKQPGGIFYNQTAETLTDFASIAELESDIEDENIYGNMKWLVSPKFKAALRTLSRGENVALNAYSNGELDGTPVLSTTHIASKKGVYGDWSQLVIGQFGGIDLLVDPYT